MSGHRTEPELQGTRAEHRSTRVGDVHPTVTRWTRVCAWDGHELGEMDYVLVSAHERVCRFHQAQFQTWLQDTSQRMYRAEGGDAGLADGGDSTVPAST